MGKTERIGNILLEERTYASLMPSVREAIDLITLDKEHPPEIVGSYRYIIHEYPVDIDLFETCSYTSMSKTVVVDKILRSFQDMAVRIRKAKKTYLADFKAGEDERYVCPFLQPYDAPRIREWIVALYDAGLLTSPEKKEWLGLVHPRPTLYQHMDLEDRIHKKCVIRWTLSELKRGKKKLPGNVVYTLADAIQSQTVIKIDIWTWIDRRFVEVTNWFRLRYRPSRKKRWEELTQPLPVYEESIRKGIREFFEPSLEKNMKMAKRIWLYAVFKHDIYLLKTLYPIFRSDAARIGQVRGEIEILLNLLERPNPPLSLILDQITQFNETISTITQNVIPYAEKQRILKRISRIINDRNQQAQISPIISCLEYIDKKFVRYIQRYVYAILKKKHIFARLEKMFAMPSPSAKPSGYILTG